MQPVEDRGRILPSCTINQTLSAGDAQMRLTDFLVEQNAQTTRVHSAEFAEVVDYRIDDDPQVALLVVLSQVNSWATW